MSVLKSHTIILGGYNSKKSKKICKEFNVNSDEFIVVSYRTNCYGGLLSKRASFRNTLVSQET